MNANVIIMGYNQYFRYIKGEMQYNNDTKHNIITLLG